MASSRSPGPRGLESARRSVFAHTRCQQIYWQSPLALHRRSWAESTIDAELRLRRQELFQVLVLLVLRVVASVWFMKSNQRTMAVSRLFSARVVCRSCRLSYVRLRVASVLEFSPAAAKGVVAFDTTELRQRLPCTLVDKLGEKVCFVSAPFRLWLSHQGKPVESAVTTTRS